MSADILFTPVTLGKLTLKNRMVMAPMTRNRAAEGNIPQAMNVEYYRQRASAGLIISEASQVSPEGIGYPGTPGIHSEAQVSGWQKVTDAVHDEGGFIYLQLWYCGRISHPDLLPDKQTPVAPSAIKPEGEVATFEGMKAFVEPRALEINEIQNIVASYKNAAQMAKTPENSFNSMSDSNPQAHFNYFITQLNKRNLAYLHILEGDMMGAAQNVNYRALRDVYKGIYMANNGYDKNRAQTAISNGDCDLVAFGVPFLANPDLVHRYKNNLPLNEADQATFYGGDETGYTDYPYAEQEITETA